MRVAIFGGTGYAGSAIATELKSRGHDVVPIARTADAAAGVVAGSVHDAESLSQLTAGADVVVVAVNASGRDGNPSLDEAIPALAALVATTGQRLGVVGGAGGLRVADGGPRLVEGANFPDAIKPEAEAQLRVSDELEATADAVDWFYVRPAQLFGAFAPGERTGSYRVGGDTMIVDADGKSAISGSDFAIAVADEMELPAHRRRAFSVAY